MASNNPIVLIEISQLWSLKREFEDGGRVICEDEINYVLKDME